MKSISAFVISVLLSQALCQEAVPRAHGWVSKLLQDFLDPVLEELSTKNLTIPELNLGEEVGKFWDVAGSISGGLTREIDGNGRFGFKLHMDLKKILLEAQYDLKYLNLPRLFPLYGKGALQAEIERMSLDVVLDARYNSTNETFDMTFPVFNLSAGRSMVKFDSLMDDPNVTDFLNELISDLVPDLVTTASEPLLLLAKTYSALYGNGILTCVKNELFKVKECIERLFGVTVGELLPTNFAGIITQIVTNKSNVIL